LSLVFSNGFFSCAKALRASIGRMLDSAASSVAVPTDRAHYFSPIGRREFSQELSRSLSFKMHGVAGECKGWGLTLLVSPCV